MTRLTVRTGGADDFFERARAAARKADRGEVFGEASVTLAFEDPKRMFAVLSEARRQLVREVLHTARSADELAERLHRDRAGIVRDIRRLERCGLLVAEDGTTGEGVKRVRAVAPRIELVAAIG